MWVESPLAKVQARVRLYQGLWPNAVYLPPGLGHRSAVKWGRGSAAPLVVGENVNRLLAGDGVTRVKIYKVWRKKERGRRKRKDESKMTDHACTCHDR